MMVIRVKVNDVYLRADQLEANLKNPRASKTDLYVTGNGTMLKGYVSKGDKFSSSYKGVILEDISDVYKGEGLSEKEMDLTNENRTLFTGFVSYFNKPLISLTDTLYKELVVKSIYQYI